MLSLFIFITKEMYFFRCIPASVWFVFGSRCSSPFSLYSGKIDAFCCYRHINIMPVAYWFYKVICLNLMAGMLDLKTVLKLFLLLLFKQWSMFIGNNIHYSGVEELSPRDHVG